MKAEPVDIEFYIARYWQEHNFAPSIRDIAAEFCCSVSTVADRLGILRRGGSVVWEVGKGRTLRIHDGA